ncbi:MAG: 50S ribosomal protein L11 methyltransferase [Clostridia bacterium]|nr:50S ribosomal protein L11 methyltransferase [Clostridia bacterium]
MDWTEVLISVDTKDIELAESIAHMVVPYGIYIEDYSNLEDEALEIAHIDLIDEDLLKKDRTKAIIHIYISPEENPAEATAFLEERFKSENIEYTIGTTLCKNEDWENNWKAYFKPMNIGNKLLIKPVWYDDIDTDRVVLNIEPGLAFGSGTHQTTRLCLETLENYITDGCEVLDVGCGSGILSVASLLLGADSAIGVDIDKLAVKTAKDNGTLNNYSEPELTFKEGNLTDKIDGKFDVVVANIVADIIIKLSSDIQKYMKPDGYFITSGIIDMREDEILNAFNENNFEVIDRHEDGGWLCFVCKIKKG